MIFNIKSASEKLTEKKKSDLEPYSLSKYGTVSLFNTFVDVVDLVKLVDHVEFKKLVELKSI